MPEDQRAAPRCHASFLSNELELVPVSKRVEQRLRFIGLRSPSALESTESELTDLLSDLMDLDFEVKDLTWLSQSDEVGQQQRSLRPADVRVR